jgi:hypothetical protein
MAEVAVDRKTGHVQVKRVVMTQDMGPGYALSEGLQCKDGKILEAIKKGWFSQADSNPARGSSSRHRLALKPGARSFLLPAGEILVQGPHGHPHPDTPIPPRCLMFQKVQLNPG